MTDKQAHRSSRAARVINASAGQLYDAFTDPEVLVAWLPPAQMTGAIHSFDASVGGGYRMSLRYPPEQRGRGKTSPDEDVVNVRFVELVRPARIVETVTFAAQDPSLSGEMKLTITFEPVPGGTEVVLLFENLPPGLRTEDNDAGARLSLEQLAGRFE